MMLDPLDWSLEAGRFLQRLEYLYTVRRMLALGISAPVYPGV